MPTDAVVSPCDFKLEEVTHFSSAAVEEAVIDTIESNAVVVECSPVNVATYGAESDPFANLAIWAVCNLVLGTAEVVME